MLIKTFKLDAIFLESVTVLYPSIYFNPLKSVTILYYTDTKRLVRIKYNSKSRQIPPFFCLEFGSNTWNN